MYKASFFFQDWFLVIPLYMMLASCEGEHKKITVFIFILPSVFILLVFGGESTQCCTRWDGEGKQQCL